MNITLPLILCSVLLNAIAQLLLKLAMGKIGQFNFVLKNFWPIGKLIISNPYIILGMCVYAMSIAVWLLVLSRTDVSLAYPMVSIGYIVTAVLAYFMIGETISIERIVGIFVIIAGVYLVAKT